MAICMICGLRRTSECALHDEVGAVPIVPGPGAARESDRRGEHSAADGPPAVGRARGPEESG